MKYEIQPLKMTYGFVLYAAAVIAHRSSAWTADDLASFGKTKKGRTVFPRGLTKKQAAFLLNADPSALVPQDSVEAA